MIVEGLLNLVSLFIGVLLTPIRLAALPDRVLTVIQAGLGYIFNGFAIVAGYTHFDFLLALFAICVAVDALMLTYKGIMWILRKIPFLSIR